MSACPEYPEYPPGGVEFSQSEIYWHIRGWIPASRLGAWKRGQDGGA